MLTACLSVVDLLPLTSSDIVDDLAEKTKLIVTLSKVERSRLLDITHQEKIQPREQSGQ